MSKLVASFSEVNKNDIPLVGETGANLGEMKQAGFPVPNGFIVTSEAYRNFIIENKLEIKIKHLFSTTNFDDEKSLKKTSLSIRKYIKEGRFSEKLIKEIISAYNKLSTGPLAEFPLVAIRTSLINEGFSKMVMSDFYLNVKGDAVLLEKIKDCWASFFNVDIIRYGRSHEFSNAKAYIALVVQKMVESDTSGIMRTINPDTNDKSKIVIEAIYGLGELLTKKEENPDRYEINKYNFSTANTYISHQKYVLKKIKDANKKIKLTGVIGKVQKVSALRITELANLAAKIEKHYYFPQEIEWAIENNQIYILRTKPITTILQAAKNNNSDLSTSDIALKGVPISSGIASGPVKIIISVGEINKVMTGDVLVIKEIIPDFISAMKKATAVITDDYDRSSYTSTIIKKFGIPVIAGTKHGTKILKTGNIVTVNGTKGEVYKGGFALKQSLHGQKEPSAKTATKLYVNLTGAKLLEEKNQEDFDGVGLLHAELLLKNIGIHPKKMLHDGRKQEFINKLADEIAAVCQDYVGKPVIYEISNLKTDEYRNLAGGNEFEPYESNPVLGFRGAIRHIYDPKVFEMELEAIKNVREKMGIKNLSIMISFVRTVEELIEIKKLIDKTGLKRSPDFKLWLALEIPSNIIMLDKYIEVGVDGISIDSDCLTMLIMGADRNNMEITNKYNEMSPAVLWGYEHIIKTANKHSLITSISGRTLSAYPELIRNLVSWGISSITVLPDEINITRQLLTRIEKELLNR